MRITAAFALWALATSAGAFECEDHKDSDRVSLACNLYFEAHTEGYRGMLAVASVTMNRVGSPNHPNTVRAVVWEDRQFSWTHDGKRHDPANRFAWHQAMRIARRFTLSRDKIAELCPTANQINARLIGRPDPGCQPYENIMAIRVLVAQATDPTGGALFYHATYVDPYWKSPRHRSAKIGAHVFYVKARIR